MTSAEMNDLRKEFYNYGFIYVSTEKELKSKGTRGKIPRGRYGNPEHYNYELCLYRTNTKTIYKCIYEKNSSIRYTI